MDIFNQESNIVITCNKRLAPYLEAEVIKLGITPESVFQTGVIIKANGKTAIGLNLKLRCASQILYSLAKARVQTPQQLYDFVYSYSWENLIDVENYLSVTCNANTPSINNTMFLNVKVKDAIVDKMRKVFGRRPNSGPLLNGVVIHVYWKDDEAELFIDTSGETLAKHGYRKIPGKAPMLEALAAATIYASGWDGEKPFVNPMCGSGTLAIEAALMATNRYPGLFRKHYAFSHVKGFDPAYYDTVLAEIKDVVTDKSKRSIIATDISKDAIHVLKTNAEVAGVSHLLHVEKCDFADTPVPSEPGVVFINPEYGERLGEVQELETTYARIGDFLKQRCSGYRAFIFTGNLELAKKIGLKASRRIEFYNAKIDCRLLTYELYAGTKRNFNEQLPIA
ncbi:MAG: class I SAM-dependent RNA methyltransferase [Chryseotalea sp.]